MLTQVKEEAIDKILAIEQQANRDCQPIYKDRAKLISKIPSFWKFVLLQHWLLERLITQEDQEVLDYLEQVCHNPWCTTPCDCLHCRLTCFLCCAI